MRIPGLFCVCTMFGLPISTEPAIMKGEVSDVKIVSWNLNGLLSCVKNHSFIPIADIAPDIICCQEIRTKQQMEVVHAYEHYWNPSERDGFHGTMSLSRREPLRVVNLST